MSLFSELKRRNVFRVAAAYVIVGWLIMQVGEVMAPALLLPDWVLSALAFFLILGFPVALVFAWAFELTAEGVRLEKDVDRGKSITRRTGRRLDFLVIALLALALGFFAFDKFVLAPDREAAIAESAVEPEVVGLAKESVAVLPFVAISSGEDDEYFADGLTEEIINSLAALPELLVTARTSAFHFKGQDLPVPEIAARLGVVHIVEGSVRRAGERVRITAQLIRAADGFHLWSETYDHTLEDVFAVQEDIARNIAETLDVVLDEGRLASMRNAGIRDVEAFIAYQKGQEAFVTAHADLHNTTELLRLATPYFEQALEAAPDLAAARVLKADAAGHVVFDLAAGLTREAYPGQAFEALDSVRLEYRLALRSTPPGNQRDILEVERDIFAEDWTGLAAKIERALQPGSCPETNWALILTGAMGYVERSLHKVRERLRCDPYYATANFRHAFLRLRGGDPAAALRVVEDAQARGISFVWLEDAAMYALLALGEFDDPRLKGWTGPQGWLPPYPREILVHSLRGDSDAARSLAETHWAGPGASDFSSLTAAAVVGDRQRANRHAARIDARPGGALVLVLAIDTCLCGAPFDLEATPNFKARVEEAGFSWPPATVIRFPAKDW